MAEAKQRHISSVRKLVAIMFTDIVGYTKLMGEDENVALALLRKNRDTHKKFIPEYHGQFLKEMGDGILASFENSSDAVICAAAIMKASNEKDVSLRIGIHMGEVIFENNDVFGDGVNIASRIEPLAEPNQILISETVHNNVQNKPGITTNMLGEKKLKGVERAMVIYQAVVHDEFLTPRTKEEKKKALSPLYIALIGLIMIMLSLGGYWLGLNSQEPPMKNPINRYTIEIDYWLGRTGRHSLAFSPDGKFLAYVSNRQIFLKSIEDIGSGRPMEVTGNPRELFFSPDGKWIGYEDTQNSSMMKVNVSGGRPQMICTLESGSMGIHWYEDGIIFGQNRAFYRVNPNGGIPEKIYPENDITFSATVWNPQLLPDGKTVLYNQFSEAGQFWDVRIVEMGSNKEPQVLIDQGTDVRYLESGYIAYLKNETLQIASFDARLKSVGSPHLLTSDPIHPNNRAGQFVFNNHGTLVYRTETRKEESERHLVWIDFTGKTEMISREPTQLMSPVVSRDGQQIAVDLKSEEGYNIVIYNPLLGTATNFTTQSSSIKPVWAPDNISITYSQMGDSSTAVYIKPVDLSYPETLLFHESGAVELGNWSIDGRYLVFENGDIGYFDRVDSTVHYLDFINTEGPEFYPSLSPDGKWLSYSTYEDDQVNLYVVPFPGPGQAHRISIDEGMYSVWSPDMKTIYFLGEDSKGKNVSRAKIQTKPKFSSSVPEVLFYGEFATPYRYGSGSFDIHPDGDRFLMQLLNDPELVSESNIPKIDLQVVVNWPGLLDEY